MGRKKTVDILRFSAEDEIPQDFLMSVSRKKISEDFTLHWHDFFEIELVLSGRATHLLNGKEYPLGRGDIFVLNPSDYHGIRVIEELELINIMLDESLIRTQLLDALLSCKRDIMFTLQEEEFDSVYPLFARLVEEFEAGRKYKEIFMKDILECIFITIARQFAFAYNPSSDADKEPVRRAILYIHSHFRDDLSLAEAAAITGLSEKYFCTLFHQSVGQTFKSYLNSLRANYARKLLETGMLSVTEACYASGFGSLSSFLREYKKNFSTSPGALKRQESEMKQI